MNNFNPLNFAAFKTNQENISKQQAKAQEIFQAVASEAHKQASQFPERVQSLMEVSQQNISDLQATVQHSAELVQQPQKLFELWTNQLQNIYNRNVAAFAKHNEENVVIFNGLKKSFDEFSEQVKSESASTLNETKTAVEALTKEAQEHLVKAQNQIKESIDTVQKTTTKNIEESFKSVQNISEQIQGSLNEGIEQVTKATKNQSSATKNRTNSN